MSSEIHNKRKSDIDIHKQERQRRKQDEDEYWKQLRQYVDQELLINPDLLDNEYFQDFLYYHYCHYRTNDPNTHLYIIIGINQDYLDASWTKEKQEQAITSKKLAPHFPPVCNIQARSRIFY